MLDTISTSRSSAAQSHAPGRPAPRQARACRNPHPQPRRGAHGCPSVAQAQCGFGASCSPSTHQCSAAAREPGADRSETTRLQPTARRAVRAALQRHPMLAVSRRAALLHRTILTNYANPANRDNYPSLPAGATYSTPRPRCVGCCATGRSRWSCARVICSRVTGSSPTVRAEASCAPTTGLLRGER